ncbi:MAG: phosphotransferase [Verrucomicrobiota bacterium]
MNERIGGFILAAGEGRRLRPATFECPKALIPFCGIPLLELIASRLRRLELSAHALNVCTEAERVAAAAERCGADLGFSPRISREHSLLDTGGGIRQGARHLPNCDHILVHNDDIILDFDLLSLIRRHLSTGAAATLLLVPARGPRTVDIESDGRIRDFRLPPGTGEYTFSGVHILRQDLLDWLPDRPICSIIEAYEHALKADLPVMGMPLTAGDYWADLGTSRQYVRAHGEIMDCPLQHDPLLRSAQSEQSRRRNDLEQSGVLCTGALGLGSNIHVPPGSHLHNAVLWDGTHLSRSLLYADGIISGGTVPPLPSLTPSRTPDPRLLRTLGLTVDSPKKNAGAQPAASIRPLQKRGSARIYARLSNGQQTWIWCAYNPERRENAAAPAIADFLKRLNINVPDIHLHLPDTCEMVCRDLGQRDLLHEPRNRQPQILRKVVKQIARLHVLGPQALDLEELPLQRSFTKGLYDWERDYFRRHILETLLERTDLWPPAAREYCELRTQLLQTPQVPIHRDLQSANIMIHNGDPFLIDFQGMRLGCAAYDLASLLYDPYQSFPRELRNRIWRHYRECVRALGGAPPDSDMLPRAAIQRLMQALGAFGKLWLQDGLNSYRPYIKSGLSMLQTAAQDAKTMPGFERLTEQARTAFREHPGRQYPQARHQREF